jgi:hypothetical protein
MEPLDYFGDTGHVDDADMDMTTEAGPEAALPAEGEPAEEPHFGTITYEELQNPDTGAAVEWDVDTGYTDASTGEPVDYWKTESI